MHNLKCQLTNSRNPFSISSSPSHQPLNQTLELDSCLQKHMVQRIFHHLQQQKIQQLNQSFKLIP
jgi:hypothetical protein